MRGAIEQRTSFRAGFDGGFFVGLVAAAVWAVGGVGCTTDDVTTQPPDTRNLYALEDDAFAEYLIFRQVPGVVENDAGAPTTYSLDVDAVDEVTELQLSKTSGAIDDLRAAGVATAEQKIQSLDGLQHFTGLERLTITSNEVTSLDLTRLIRLVTLEMNFNLVGSLNLTQNVALQTLRYRASGSAGDGQRLDRLDLSSNTDLRHLFLPGHDLTGIDLRANTLISEVLDLSDNPGPDGDRDTADIVVPAAIFDQVPPENRAGVISDADAPVQLSLTLDATTISEAGGSTMLRAIINRTSTAAISTDLQFGGTATIDVDYSVADTSLSIEPGAMEAVTTITATDDMDEEGRETIEIQAANVVNAQPAGVVVGLTLTDDDGALPLVLNEVLYDPPDDAAGDANGDGARDPNEDEFVELVNVSAQMVDVSGLEFYDVDALDMGMPRHTVPAGTMLAPQQALVIFGGGTPTGSFGGAVVQVANGFENRLNLNNSDDFLTIQRAGGPPLLEFDVEALSNNPNESYTRSPDLTGDFVQHASVEEGVLFSPGTRIDGSSF